MWWKKSNQNRIIFQMKNTGKTDKVGKNPKEKKFTT